MNGNSIVVNFSTHSCGIMNIEFIGNEKHGTYLLKKLLKDRCQYCLKVKERPTRTTRTGGYRH